MQLDRFWLSLKQLFESLLFDFAEPDLKILFIFLNESFKRFFAQRLFWIHICEHFNIKLARHFHGRILNNFLGLESGILNVSDYFFLPLGSDDQIIPSETLDTRVWLKELINDLAKELSVCFKPILEFLIGIFDHFHSNF